VFIAHTHILNAKKIITKVTRNFIWFQGFRILIIKKIFFVFPFPKMLSSTPAQKPEQEMYYDFLSWLKRI